MWALGSHRECVSERGPWPEHCAWGELASGVLGSALGLQTWGTCCGAHSCHLTHSYMGCVRAAARPGLSRLQFHPACKTLRAKKRPALDLSHLGSRDSPGAQRVGVGSCHMCHTLWPTPTSASSLPLSR